MTARLFAPTFLALVWHGGIAAQSPNVRPQIQIAGESDGTPQSQEGTQEPDKSESIVQFESKLQTHPDDVLARTALARLYSQTGQNDKSLEQFIWLIQHHPEAMIPPGILGGPEGKFAAANYQQLKIAWDGTLADHSDDPQVLYCGGLFLQESEPERALELFSHARQLEPSKPIYLEAVARIYEEAVLYNRAYQTPIVPLNEELATRLRNELPNLNDAALLSQVGSGLAQIDQRAPDNPNQQMGLRLIERATVLEPDNPQWKTALETAKNLPTMSPASSDPPDAVRIASAVAEANLMKKTELVYPALAKAVRVSGSVEFTAVIGIDGHIQSLQFVRGHPLLIKTGRETVLQYIYKPTLLNGNPVPVITSVVISFELPPQ